LVKIKNTHRNDKIVFFLFSRAELFLFSLVVVESVVEIPPVPQTLSVPKRRRADCLLSAVVPAKSRGAIFCKHERSGSNVGDIKNVIAKFHPQLTG